MILFTPTSAEIEICPELMLKSDQQVALVHKNWWSLMTINFWWIDIQKTTAGYILLIIKEVLTKKWGQIIHLQLSGQKRVLLNIEGTILLNYTENQLYDVDQFPILISFEAPKFPTRIINNGNLIFGCNNNTEWLPNNDSSQERCPEFITGRPKNLKRS